MVCSGFIYAMTELLSVCYCPLIDFNRLPDKSQHLFLSLFVLEPSDTVSLVSLQSLMAMGTGWQGWGWGGGGVVVWRRVEVL